MHDVGQFVDQNIVDGIRIIAHEMPGKGNAVFAAAAAKAGFGRGDFHSCGGKTHELCKMFQTGRKIFFGPFAVKSLLLTGEGRTVFQTAALGGKFFPAPFFVGGKKCSMLSCGRSRGARTSTCASLVISSARVRRSERLRIYSYMAGSVVVFFSLYP